MVWGMSGRPASIVLVVRMWQDDDGIRAVLKSSTTPGETAYASIDALRRALGEVLDTWPRESDGGSQAQPLGRE
jgi:hypothetical protein